MGNTESFFREFGTPSKFHPHLHYNESLGCLQVLLRDCSMCEVAVTSHVDVLKDNHPRKKQGIIIGFNLWGVRGVLYDQGYTRSSISLECLIKRFDRQNKLPFETSVFGRYDKHILHIARTHQFVWHIPK